MIIMDFREFLEQKKSDALSGKLIERNEVIRLLETELYSADMELLGKTAREIAAKVTDNKARIWTAVGVDFVPCTVNCDFCSFGERWGIIKKPYEWNIDEIVKMAEHFLEKGAKWVTLRTTEYYPADKIVEIADCIHHDIAGDYHLVVNTGEFTPEIAERFKKHGIDVVYHSLRLREGIQTGIKPEYRCRTMAAVQQSPLDLAFLIEPVGREHTNDELADVFMTAMHYGAKLTGAMARVPVKGTPLGDIAALDERRLAHITAVSRICAGINAPDVCVHPPVKQAVEWGANVMVVESGAIPRDSYNGEKEWNVFSIDDARRLFNEAGYKIDEGIKR